MRPEVIEFAKYVAVPLGATILRAVFWFKSPEAWVAFCEKSPRLAAIIKIVRAIGIEPLQVLDALEQVGTGRTPPGKPAHRTIPPPPKMPTIRIDELPQVPPAEDTQPAPRGVVITVKDEP